MGLGGTIGLFVLLACAVYAQQPKTLDEKVANLQEILHRQPVLKINNDRWKTYVRSQPRNYSMIVLFTALSPGINCPICKPAYDEFLILANSHRYANSDLKSLYFAVVDYEEAPQVFQQMNLNTAPVLYHFGPKLQGKKKPDQMDFQRRGIDADAMSRFIAETTEIDIRVLRPPNYTTPVIIFLFGGLLVGLLWMKRNSLDFIYSKRTWGLICLSITFIFLSGQMWNHIRSPPLMITNPQTKETTIIHSSTQYQLTAETYLVGFMYAMITFGFIIMNDAIPDETTSKKKSNKDFLGLNLSGSALAFAGLAIVVIFYSFLLSVFRSKHRGYPYSFLFS